MLLVDKEIKELINEGILKNANAENIGAISYDLIIDEIICTSKPIQKCTQMQLNRMKSFLSLVKRIFF